MPPDVSASDLSGVIGHVLTPQFLRHLGRMRLTVRRAVGARPGDTPVRRGTHPSGIELESHKAYDAGDEPRFLDWNAYARLDQLLVKRFRAEREAPLVVFIDGSASMGVPASDGKFTFAIGLALSLAYVAVRRHDPVTLVVLGDFGARARYVSSPTVRLTGTLQRLATFCGGLAPSGSTALTEGITAYVQQHRTPSSAIVLSDFLVDPDAWRASLQQLASRGFEITALRLLGVGERNPEQLFRRARLYDVETGRERVVSLHPANAARYQQALDNHTAKLRETCAAHAALFAVCDTAQGLESCLFRQLPGLGLLR